jgi:hypothetical protein
VDEEKSVAAMLSLDDPRWAQLKGGRRTPCDPRPLLAKLERGEDTKAVWHTLWDELHHQGDVDEASYACVPHLVRIYRQRGILDWNTFGIAVIVELKRGEGHNPQVPAWLEAGYFDALRELAEIGIREINRAKEVGEVRAILSMIALQKGARTHARFLLEYSSEELLDLESAASEL